MADLIGTLAAILTTVSFVPQAVLVLRTRNTDGLSLIMYLMFTCGVACWLSYGLLIASVPIILANSVTILLASLILFMKIRNMLALTASARRQRPIEPPERHDAAGEVRSRRLHGACHPH
jgi:MtN3 and saliva related transmembrane protein